MVTVLNKCPFSEWHHWDFPHYSAWKNTLSEVSCLCPPPTHTDIHTHTPLFPPLLQPSAWITVITVSEYAQLFGCGDALAFESKGKLVSLTPEHTMELRWEHLFTPGSPKTWKGTQTWNHCMHVSTQLPISYFNLCNAQMKITFQLQMTTGKDIFVTDMQWWNTTDATAVVCSFLFLCMCALKISITASLLSKPLSSLQGEQGPVGSPGAKGYPGRQVQ